MSPKFSLGVAVGFMAAVIFKNRPYRQALTEAGEGRRADALEGRLCAIETLLDQGDALLLQRARDAARAFRPAQRSGSDITALRQDLARFSRVAVQSAEDFRRQLDSWSQELPAWIQDAVLARPAEAVFGQVDLSLPAPPPDAESPQAAPAVTPLEGMLQRLVRQRQEMDGLGEEAVALERRLAGKGYAIARTHV